MPTLFFDTTKFQRQKRHRSGLNRVSVSLQGALSASEEIQFKRVVWSTLKRGYVDAENGASVGRGAEGDAFFTPETFAIKERFFCRSWMRRFRGESGVLFHDAIPYYHPETTWPRSVRRFPHWFQDLAAYDRVMFVSREAREHARDVARETGWCSTDGSILPLGADYAEGPLERRNSHEKMPILLNIGIIEHRKGQARLLEAAESLWARNFSFKLVFLGRINPHFGQDIAQEIAALKARGRPVIHEADADDKRLAYWHQQAGLVVLPTRAEGFGLPAVEALWAGCPVLATNHPSLADLGTGSGVRILNEPTTGNISAELEKLLSQPSALREMESQIDQDALPRWNSAARHLVQDLGLLASS